MAGCNRGRAVSLPFQWWLGLNNKRQWSCVLPSLRRNTAWSACELVPHRLWPSSHPVYLRRSPRRRPPFSSGALISVSSSALLFSALPAECARAGCPPHTLSSGLWQSCWSCDLAAEKEDTSTASGPSPPLWEITWVKWSEVKAEGNWHDEPASTCEAQLHRLHCFRIDALPRVTRESKRTANRVGSWVGGGGGVLLSVLNCLPPRRKKIIWAQLWTCHLH